MAVRVHWSVVSEAEFWENLHQVASCGCFKVSSSISSVDTRKDGGNALFTTYSVEFHDSDGAQSCDVFTIYYAPDFFDPNTMRVFYMVSESNLTLLATLAAIETLLGDVVPES